MTNVRARSGVLVLLLASMACSETAPPTKDQLGRSSQATVEKIPLAEIDFSRIGRIAPKGRVQDRDYQELKVVDQLLAHGKDSIPFLIDKLDDETVIKDHVMDYWPEITVGDVSLIILSDFSLNATWDRQTIPGTSYDEILGVKLKDGVPFWEQLEDQVHRYGRAPIKARWQRIWDTYKDRIVWDESERCFKVA